MPETGFLDVNFDAFHKVDNVFLQTLLLVTFIGTTLPLEALTLHSDLPKKFALFV